MKVSQLYRPKFRSSLSNKLVFPTWSFETLDTGKICCTLQRFLSGGSRCWIYGRYWHLNWKEVGEHRRRACSNRSRSEFRSEIFSLFAGCKARNGKSLLCICAAREDCRALKKERRRVSSFSHLISGETEIYRRHHECKISRGRACITEIPLNFGSPSQVVFGAKLVLFFINQIHENWTKSWILEWNSSTLTLKYESGFATVKGLIDLWHIIVSCSV